MKKTLILPLCAALLSACGDNGVLQCRDQANGAEPVTVTVIRCSGNEEGADNCYVGEVTPSRQNALVAPFAGKVERMLVKKGQTVREGQVVAVISAASVQSAYDAARAALERADDAYRRVKKSHESGAVSDLQLMEAESAFRQATASEKAARDAMDNLEITAPYSGTIGETFVSAGERVALGAMIARVVDVNGVEIHIAVPENEYPEVSAGQQARVSVPALGRETTARLTAKGVTATRLAHTYDCTLGHIGQSQGLMPGMVCKVYLRSPGGAGIVIPSSAVMTDFDGRYVWTIAPDSTARRQYIRVGGYSGRGVIASEGLTEGDLVITRGSRKVSTGMKVTPVAQ